jgi:hypothetical protein
MPPKIRDALYWLQAAEEARLLAEQMLDPDVKREMKRIEMAYRRLARRAQHLTKSSSDQS